LPGGALGASANDQPERIDVRHGAVADGQDEGERVEGRLPDDGVQADGGGREDLAVAEWVTVAVEGHRRGSVCRWGGANRSRLTQPPSTTFDNCSRSASCTSSGTSTRTSEETLGTKNSSHSPVISGACCEQSFPLSTSTD